MKVNDLVMHKEVPSLGIGCVSKVLPTKLKVNFGRDDVMTCLEKNLTVIDVSNCRTIPFSEYARRVLNNNSDLNDAIIGNVLMHFVGIGWVQNRVITEQDLKKYPRVTEEI